MSVRVALIEKKGILLAPILSILFVFFTPISPTIKSIFFVCVIVSILLTPYYSKHIVYAYNTLWGKAVLILVIFTFIACIWSPAPMSMKLNVFWKYFKLIFLPVLAVGFINSKLRFWTINSYLIAIFITCGCSILKAIGILHIGIEGDQGEVFYNHIVTGFMAAYGSYLAGLFAFQYKGWIRYFYFFIWLFISFQIIFINNGRTGYFLYGILMIMLLLQKLSFKQAIAGLMLLFGLFFLCFNESFIMNNRVNNLMNEIRLLKENNKETSIGYRFQFHDYAKSLWAKHPVTGIGTGGFKYSFSQDNPIPGWGAKLTDPHSQYWMILAEQGIIGFVLLVFFLGSLFVSSFQLSETRPILLGILISCCIGSVSDTILCFSTAGYLLITMSALCFGELIEKQLKEAKISNYVPHVASANVLTG